MCVCVYLAFEYELEGKGALAREVWVAFRVVDAGLQHPGLVENSEARRLVVQASDEVVGAVRPELHLCEEAEGGKGARGTVETLTHQWGDAKFPSPVKPIFS